MTEFATKCTTFEDVKNWYSFFFTSFFSFFCLLSFFTHRHETSSIVVILPCSAVIFGAFGLTKT